VQETTDMTTLTSPATLLALETFRAPGDGCLGYLVVDEVSRTALAIDPRADQLDQVQEALAARGARLAYVLDTHTHADHLSGVRSLAQRTGATALAHKASRLAWPARRMEGGATFALGARTVTVLNAPGHTPDSLAILVDGHLFTGDALFVGGAGRTDFPGGSASDLFDTFRAFEALPDTTAVHPGHDYVGRAVSTIGEEKAQNPLLRERDRSAFVARLSAKTPPPANMAAIIRHNLGEAGAAAIEPRELQTLLEGGSTPFLLDVRSGLEFESEHIDGARLIPLDQLDSRLDEIPEQAEVVAICRTGVRATVAADALGRAGRRARVLEGGMNAWRRARLPVREGRKRLPVDRQVQLIAGLMVLAGVVLGVAVSPWFLAVAAFFGAGLTFAGATGTCGLALLLMRLPWNRPSVPPAEGPGAVCAAGGGAGVPVCAAGGGASAPTCAAAPAQQR
jgi:glyoxylase-like metal-dependent hydrolase (beta-lactamase superfamily II)